MVVAPFLEWRPLASLGLCEFLLFVALRKKVHFKKRCETYGVLLDGAEAGLAAGAGAYLWVRWLDLRREVRSFVRGRERTPLQ